MKSEVTLVKGKSHTSPNGRKIFPRQPVVVTSESETRYYQSQYGFVVRVLGGRDFKTEEKETVEEETYTKEELFEMKSKRLRVIAKDLEIPLTGKEKKSELIEAILLATNSEEDEE